MAEYDIDDPNKIRLVGWENIDEWLVSTGACKSAVDWVYSKRSDESVNLEKQRILEGKYVLDSVIPFLHDFITEKHYGWAEWFIIQIMEESEYKEYVRFALEQIPKGVSKESESVTDSITQSDFYAKDAVDNNKPSSARKVVEYVIRINALHNPEGNTDILLEKILNYGISLIEKRGT